MKWRAARKPVLRWKPENGASEQRRTASLSRDRSADPAAVSERRRSRATIPTYIFEAQHALIDPAHPSHANTSFKDNSSTCAGIRTLR